MANTIQVHTHYIFLDIVKFSGRTAEAQTDLVEALNRIVLGALSENGLSVDTKTPAERPVVVLLPTGDGICICLLGSDLEYDIYLIVALAILKAIDNHNAQCQDSARKFEVRVGINYNVDNLVTDINGRWNMAGQGINDSQRIMSKSDGNQILVGDPVLNVLGQREKYIGAFRKYVAVVKYGREFIVHQFMPPGHPGLNTNPPLEFAPPPVSRPTLTRYVAHYIATALRHRDLLVSAVAINVPAAIVWIHYKATDAEKQETWRPTYGPFFASTLAADSSPEEQISQYQSIPYRPLSDFSWEIIGRHLSPYSELFERDRYATPDYVFPSPLAEQVLTKEHPDLLAERTS